MRGGAPRLAAAWTPVRLDHAGLSVADLDAAVGVLRRAPSGSSASSRSTLPGEIRGVMLRLPSGGRLELFERPESGGGLRAGAIRSRRSRRAGTGTSR